MSEREEHWRWCRERSDVCLRAMQAGHITMLENEWAYWFYRWLASQPAPGGGV